MNISKDEYVLMTAGEYSDYSIYALCKALCDFSVDDVRDEYLQKYPEQKSDNRFSYDSFIKWLIVDKKVLAEMDYAELCNCGYWTSEMTVTKEKRRT